MNQSKIPEFLERFREFKKSDDYQFRIRQSGFAKIAKEIIKWTLRNDPITNQHLTGLIQMFKVDTSSPNFDKYLLLNIPDPVARKRFLEEMKLLGYKGYSGAGLAAIKGLSDV